MIPLASTFAARSHRPSFLRRLRRALGTAFVLLLAPGVAGAVQVTIPALKDNTLYESPTGATSNGVGEYLFTGRTKDGLERRAVVAFDIAAVVPAGATINNVSLQLHLSRVANNTLRFTSVHRLLADWGEGTSNAGQNEGQGAPSTTNDATWIHRFFATQPWSTPGGDHQAAASATTAVMGNGTYTWTSAAMVLDVQGWLTSPASNFGWLVIGDESVVETAKRFDSRENGQVASRPALVVDYSLASGTGACCLPAGDCSVVTATQCATLGGTWQGDGTNCTPNPCGISLTLPAAQDNTLYEDATGALSNGAGTKVIVAKSPNGLVRRGLVQFDLSAIPIGSAIQGVTLSLYNAEASNSSNVDVYRASAAWGEGTSAATGSEDAGAPATSSDATWIHRSYPATLWATAGGDHAATASATTSVGGVGDYQWTSAALVADVQAWVDAPATHHGWIVRGRETGPGNSLKRFESRQSAEVARRPRLLVTYVPGTPQATGACCLPDGTCEVHTAGDCAAAGGVYHGDQSTCTTGLCPVVLAPYVDPLPLPALATPVSGTPGGEAAYVIPIREVSQKLHRDLPPTRVWGYDGTYPGPTILATRDQPVTVTWVNDLRDSLGVLRTTHFLPVDECLQGPDTHGATPRIVTHLHGGHVPAAVDGHPDHTLLPGEQVTYVYPNHQDAATLWYHDHAMGITRLNVMMGMAGFYLLKDATENALPLPVGEYEIGLAIQDRAFNADGSLQYPATWVDHFFGDKLLVNGKVWPYLQVKQGKYRFRMLNGCNSRVLRLSLSNGAPFAVIGTEAGLLPAPVTRTVLLLTPGERADVVIDFASQAAGTQIVLANDAPAPYPGEPGEGVIPNVMRFDVVGAGGWTEPLPATLRPVVPIPPAEAAITRDFLLKKSPHPCTGDIWLINDLPFDAITERPVLGTTEIWRFLNSSGVTHPMHMHLVSFQVLDRQPFTMQGNEVVPTGPPVPPDASEAGWKDTAPVDPGMMLRVIARFEDYAGIYPYHCHVLEHEDNEMMRQLESVPAPEVSVADAAILEGDAGSANLAFTVTLASAVQVEARVTWSTADVSASGGTDYTVVAPQVLVFPPGTTSLPVSVPVLGDLAEEADETFEVRLTGAVVAVLGDSVAIGRIRNDDGNTAVIDDPVPTASYLGPGRPNPAKDHVTLRWGLHRAGAVELEIFDVHGRLVRRFAEADVAAGEKTLAWNGCDDAGARVPSGMYIVRLRAHGQVYRRAIMLLK